MKNFNSLKYLKQLDKYFRAANYLSVAQLYLKSNPLLFEPFKRSDVKKTILGHWGTIPGQNFIYAHLNRVICKYDLDMILISGPGHGGNFFLSNCYLEGSYSEIYPSISQNKEGLTKLCKQFSFPGGASSHVAPETPGSIHEGGELGYSLLHGYGAVLDNKDLIAAVVVGDGEAETGPLATSWQSNKFINPKSDGAVLPILHLNGYKISNPTVLARISEKELKSFFYGMGYKPYIVEGSNNLALHRKMAKVMDKCIKTIKNIQFLARSGKLETRPIWPMIILKTKKGWTGPKVVENKLMEGSFRSHQVPLTIENENDFKLLEKWLRSYRIDEIFDENYKLKPDITKLLPKGNKRLGMSPYANGGQLLKELYMPNPKEFAVKVDKPGEVKAQDMLVLSKLIAEIMKLNKDNHNFRLFSPDEAMSNRLYHIFDEENRDFNAKIVKTDEFLSHDGRIMDSFLSEHACEGWLEGYLLTGRHGVFVSYEAFARVVDSMVSQHAKWLKNCSQIAWRKPISSLNLLLTSNVWQQDHNGYTHQEPGFIDHIINKKSELIGVYLPPDANCLLCVYSDVQSSKNKINTVIASKHPSYQWLDYESAREHCARGIGEWKWASTNEEKEDVIIACAGDTPTIEALAAIALAKKFFPSIGIKFVNVVDLMTLDPSHPHGLERGEFEKLFPKNKPIIFNYHGYPKVIREMFARRGQTNVSIHGYQEEGSITTAFDMRVQNEIDRYHLLLDINAKLKHKSQEVEDYAKKMLDKHYRYIRQYGVDMPEITSWKWE